MPVDDRIAPWDVMTFYQLPVEKVKNVTLNNTQLVPSDPQRDLLIFGVVPPNTNAMLLSTNPNAAGTMGIQLSTAGALTVINYDWFGPATNAAWYASPAPGSLGSADIWTMEIRLSRWPKYRPTSDLIQPELEIISGLAQKPDNYGSGNRGYNHSWPKHEEKISADRIAKCRDFIYQLRKSGIGI